MKKQQWYLLALMLAIPIALNIVGMYRDKHDTFIEAVTTGQATYVVGPIRQPFNPWPEILIVFLGVTGHLGLLAWCEVFLFNKALRIKTTRAAWFPLSVVLALFTGVCFTIGALQISNVWVDEFQTTPIYGLDWSRTVSDGCRPLVFPSVSVLMLYTLWFPQAAAYVQRRRASRVMLQ